MSVGYIYLTIDDAPSSDFIYLIDFLFKKKINAIFFCRGDRILKNIEQVIYAVKKGFIIGNHGYSHRHFSCLTISECYNDILKTHVLINKIHLMCNVENYPKIFRFPYGDKGDYKYGNILTNFEHAYIKNQNKKLKVIIELQKLLLRSNYDKKISTIQQQGSLRYNRIQYYLKKLGYLSPITKGLGLKSYQKFEHDLDWLWTFDVGDWMYRNKYNQEVFLNNLYLRIKNKNSMNQFGIEPKIESNELFFNNIVLMHDSELTNIFFDKIINYFLSLDYSFKNPLGNLIS